MSPVCPDEQASHVYLCVLAFSVCSNKFPLSSEKQV